MGSHRRRSSCSSSSSSSSSDGDSKKWDKEKKSKKDKMHLNEADEQTHGSGHISMPNPTHVLDGKGDHPPPYVPHPQPQPQSSTLPSSGYRIPLTADAAFPDVQLTRYPPFFDADGTSPVFIGSAIFQSSVHPCKIAARLQPPCRVPYGGVEHEHRGRYDLLPFMPETMEWVRASQGRLPQDRRPVEGGYEDNGARLYHAVATVEGVQVPGKAGAHLVRRMRLIVGVARADDARHLCV